MCSCKNTSLKLPKLHAHRDAGIKPRTWRCEATMLTTKSPCHLIPFLPLARRCVLLAVVVVAVVRHSGTKADKYNKLRVFWDRHKSDDVIDSKLQRESPWCSVYVVDWGRSRGHFPLCEVSVIRKQIVRQCSVWRIHREVQSLHNYWIDK